MPSILDTISEFRVLKDNYSAKYGITGNANFSVETKSGTKEFHGNVYQYLRNDALDAKNFFDAFASQRLCGERNYRSSYLARGLTSRRRV